MKTPVSSVPAGKDRPASPLDWAVQPEVASGVMRELAERRKRRARRNKFATAMGALAIAATVWFVEVRSNDGAERDLASPATARLSVPERRVLPDGSVVELKEGAEIRVAFTPVMRRVALTRGEAHFEVARYPDRPFVVTAAGVDVRAVGTAFSVGLEASSVQVLVTHGQVAVEKRDSLQPQENTAVPEPPPTLLASLTAGNRVVVDLSGEATARNSAVAVESLEHAALAERLAWRVPRLDFSATPLSEALPLFNQHSAIRISLADSSLASLQISGIIRADNVESLLRMLETNYGVIAHRTDTEIVLHGTR